MGRTVNLAEHTVRRDAFLDVGQRLIQAKGYEAMSIQDVLDELDASRGAFYHYFDSKHALLEAVVDRFAEVAMASVAPILDDSSLTAVEKLEQFFAGIARMKAEQKPLMLAILDVWLSDGNAIVREKARDLTARLIGPLLSRLIREGIDDGCFRVTAPDATATVVLTMIQGFQVLAGELFQARQARTIPFEDVIQLTDAFTEALERVLGMTRGSLHLIDQSTLRVWFD